MNNEKWWEMFGYGAAFAATIIIVLFILDAAGVL